MALLSSAVSVYLLHDVDKDKLGQWNQAFVALSVEVALFTLVIGGGVALLTLLGRLLLHLKRYSPRATLGLFLGIGITVFQYIWDFAGRGGFPKLADTSLGLYLIVAIVFCSIVLVRDNFKQMKLHQAAATPIDNS